MILPLTFFGGFLTAIILFTAKTGIINMILIKGVLLLQIALIVGKMAYAAKELLTHKAREVVYYPQPSSYIPTPHSSYGPSHPPSYGWNRRQEEVFKDYNPSPINTYTQASPYYYNQQSPQKDYGQPQFSSGRSLTKRSSDNNSQLIISSQEDNQILTDSSMTTHLQNRQQILPLGIMIGRRRFVNQWKQFCNHFHPTKYHHVKLRMENLERKEKENGPLKVLYLSVYEYNVSLMISKSVREMKLSKISC